MPERGSLKRCVEIAIGCFRNGYSDTIVITGNRAAKYYTFMFRAEFDGKVLASPTFKPRIVLCCTGGELASIIATGQDQLSLDLQPKLIGGDDQEPAEQTSLLTTGGPDAPVETLEEREQPCHYNPDSDDGEI